MGLVSIGEFSRLSRLSPKALARPVRLNSGILGAGT